MSAIDFGPKAFTAEGTINPHRFVKIGTGNGLVDQADAAAAISDVLGVIDGAGASVAYPEANVQLVGVVRLECGAAVAFGAALMPNASGQAITATATNYARAIALSPANAAGGIIHALLISPSLQ